MGPLRFEPIQVYLNVSKALNTKFLEHQVYHIMTSTTFKLNPVIVPPLYETHPEQVRISVEVCHHTKMQS